MKNLKTYIEVGANNGRFQSRSLELSRMEDYRGILIEPNPEQHKACVKSRGNDRTFIYNKALVSFDYPDSMITLRHSTQNSSMDFVDGLSLRPSEGSTQVEASTLQSILDELSIFHIDAFFLDVEGYEDEVLRGINFDKTTFSMIEVEIHPKLRGISTEQSIEDHTNFFLKRGYTLKEIDPTTKRKIIFHPVIHIE
jgi:FkbM family methyltransferase